MRLALLLLALPAVAEAAPSAINIEETLKHDRALLASHATAICACKDRRCSKPHVDGVLAWERDQTLMKNRKGFEAYLAAVAADEAIAKTRQEFDDCNAALFVNASCKQRIASAAASFARMAPKTYKPYSTLQFTAEDDDVEEPTAFVAIAIHPGRSWSFRVKLAPHSAVDDDTLDQLGFEWGRVDNEMGVTIGRKLGPVAAVLEVKSERFGEFSPENHPLTKLFLKKFRAAAEACVK